MPIELFCFMVDTQGQTGNRRNTSADASGHCDRAHSAARQHRDQNWSLGALTLTCDSPGQLLEIWRIMRRATGA
jgi:hypothetical protein